MKLYPCVCGEPAPEPEPAYVGYSMSCSSCYDGAPDASNRGDIATAKSELETREAWNELQRDLHPYVAIDCTCREQGCRIRFHIEVPQFIDAFFVNEEEDEETVGCATCPECKYRITLLSVVEGGSTTPSTPKGTWDPNMDDNDFVCSAEHKFVLFMYEAFPDLAARARACPTPVTYPSSEMRAAMDLMLARWKTAIEKRNPA